MYFRPSTFYKFNKNQIVKDNDSYEHFKNMITVMKRFGLVEDDFL